MKRETITLWAAGMAGALVYVAASGLAFVPPVTLAEAEACGLGPEEFTASGEFALEHWPAWWLAFQRQQDYFSAVSVGLAVAFIVHALRIGRRAGAARSVGAAAGGGLLALSALCVSCLAPVMSAVGFGLAASWLAGIPKWLIALNTLIFTLWGGLVLARRGAACPLPARGASGPAPTTK